jgi:prefoldin subunit 5
MSEDDEISITEGLKKLKEINEKLTSEFDNTESLRTSLESLSESRASLEIIEKNINKIITESSKTKNDFVSSLPFD